MKKIMSEVDKLAKYLIETVEYNVKDNYKLFNATICAGGLEVKITDKSLKEMTTLEIKGLFVEALFPIVRTKNVCGEVAILGNQYAIYIKFRKEFICARVTGLSNDEIISLYNEGVPFGEVY